MYNDFLGLTSSPTKKESALIEDRRLALNQPATEFEFSRYGIPSGVVDFDEVKDQRELLIAHFLSFGYDNAPLSKLKPRFRKHVAFFRVCLDIWEQTPNTKVFDKDEIYFRCLSEGNSFTERVKKTRSTCYRAKTAETDTIIEEEYYDPRYDGYNSVIHERYLIHWDDRDEIDDVKYAFIPVERERKKEFSELLDMFWEDFRLDDVEIRDFDMIGALKNTKMYDAHKGESALMRDFWRDDIEINSPYFARRAVVPTTPGTTRDTGIGDPSTILKVKQLNMLARAYSEKVPYSANCESILANRRIKRVLRNNLFLHLDFKKFGLTFPRYMMNMFIEKIGKSTGLDVTHLLLNDFFVEIDGETYRTERGSMLGWLDAINSLCVCAILHSLSKRLGFDFVTFNDDVEISKKGYSDPQGVLQLLRIAVVTTIDFFDIPISLSKTFGSKSSVFLERYAYYEQYGIDMYKDQLCIGSYAKSCTTEFPWAAKLFFCTAWEWNKIDYARDRCMDTCPVEFRKCENTLPVWSGGWYLSRDDNLDYSLKESDYLGLVLGGYLSEYKPKRYSQALSSRNNDKIWQAVQNKAYHAFSSSFAVQQMEVTLPRVSEVNDELEYIYHCAQTACDTFAGRDETFPEKVLDLVNKLGQEFWDPGGNPRNQKRHDVLNWLVEVV